MIYLCISHQHSGSEVKLVEELRDEDVHFEHVGHVLPLDVSQDVDEPLEVSVEGQSYYVIIKSKIN